MPRGVRQGNAIEVKVARLMESEGWLVGSRRHIGGAGDLLAVKFDYYRDAETGGLHRTYRVQLIEVKATTQVPWRSVFGPTQRKALIVAAESVGAEPWLAWWPPKGALMWIPPSEWPS